MIADLLHAWTTPSAPRELGSELLSSCARHLVGLQKMAPSSPRLRRLVIRSVEFTEYAVFEELGVERFIEFLNHLHVTVEDIDYGSSWVEPLVRTILSSKEPQHLSNCYWELLVESAVSSYWLEIGLMDGLRITTSLIRAEGWSRLECWMGIVWMLLPEEADPTEGGLGHSMELLFHQRPGAVQRLEQWIKQWGRKHHNRVPKSFQRLCKQAYEAAKLD